MFYKANKVSKQSQGVKCHMRMPTGNPRLMKEINKSMILELIKAREHISRADIAKELHISPPTVSKIIDQLLAEKWIMEIGTGVSSGGRKPLLLKFNARRAFTVGAWVGDTVLMAAVADLNGQILLKREVKRPPEKEKAKSDDHSKKEFQLDKELILLIYRTLRDANIPAGKLCSIGVAVCGITRMEGGIVVRSRHLPGWENYPIQEVLEKEFSVPVVIDGDSFMAVLGEAWRGAGMGVRHLVRITIGAGIGCGILLDERVYRGADGAAGEIGDMIVADTLPAQALAERGGYLERAVGLSALVDAAGSMWAEKGRSSLLSTWCDNDPERLTAEMIFKAAVAEDELALSLVENLCEALARVIVNIVSFINPEEVIIGGELGEARRLILQKINNRVKELLCTPPPILLSSLDRDAELYGAISLALARVMPSVEVSYASSVLDRASD